MQKPNNFRINIFRIFVFATLLLIEGLECVASTCDYPFRPGSKTITQAAIRDSYGNFIFRLFVGASEQGTGFAIDPVSGYVLTAYHVVRNSQGSDLQGDLPSRPGTYYHFSVVSTLCKNYFGDQCQYDDGSDAGVDAALLKMDQTDLQVYLSNLPPTQAPFDLSLGFDISDSAYKAGYPMQGNQNIAAILAASSPMGVDKDWGQSKHARNHREWRISGGVAKGESGSPIFDANGNVFAMLLEQVGDDKDKGVALSLTEVANLLSIVFEKMVRTVIGERLRVNLMNDAYISERDVASDLYPSSITNKELTAVILDVTKRGSTKFKFKHCPVDYALMSRRLDWVYGKWEPNDGEADATTQGTMLLRDANGLLASGQPQKAVLQFVRAYDVTSQATVSKSSEDSGNSDQAAVLTMISALGAANSFEQLNQYSDVKTYAEKANHVANRLQLKEHVALANVYQYDAALALGNLGDAVKHARSAFIQYPTAIYETFSTLREREDFRVASAQKLTAFGWEEKALVEKKSLTDKLLANPKDTVLKKLSLAMSF